MAAHHHPRPPPHLNPLFQETIVDAPFPDGMLKCIERFLATDHLRGAGRDLYSEVFDTHLMFPLQRPAELRRMIEIARTIHPRVIMEIGTDKAGGLYHWCKCFPHLQRVIACEIRGLPYSTVFCETFPQIDFLWMARQSLPAPNLTTPIDILFLDGDKSRYTDDFYAYLPMMSPGGIVFVHDINDPAPSTAFQLLSRSYRHDTIMDLRDTAWALDRQSQGIPSQSPHEEWLRHWRGRSCGVGVLYLGDHL